MKLGKLFPLPLVLAAACFIAPAQADTRPEDALHALTHLFSADALVGTPKIVDCTLSGGTQTQCFAITVKGAPANHKAGPWCPRTISDSAEQGGIWVENGQQYDVDGAFIQNMDKFYKDPQWLLYDPATGKVKVTDSKQACTAAARPDVDPNYNNYCVECQLDYMEHSTERTYVLPIKPVKAAKPSPIRREGTGVAFNGVLFDGPAPKDAILGAHTLAPFDDCGGHINLHVGYHYHAVTGCTPGVAEDDGHAPAIGLAMDGYTLHARLNADGAEPDDLDECRGHETAGLGYHYHVNEPGKNAILACHTAELGCANEGGETACDATQRRGPPPPPK